MGRLFSALACVFIVGCGGSEDAPGAGGAAGTSSGGASSGGASSGGASSGGASSGGASSGGASSGGTGGGAGSPGTGCTLVWESGFENGFPGEWLNYDNGSWSPSGVMPSGRVSAWTIIDKGGAEPVLSGNKGYKGWIIGAASESHRAYPGVHTDIETPVVNTFWVRLDADYGKMGPSEWIHFGTWGNEDNGQGVWALHTMSVRDKKLEFAHTNPFSGKYIGPSPQPDFPLGQWVRFTAYIHYQGTTGTVRMWQDGVAVLEAEVAQLATHPGTKLTRAHWGMYASKETTQGVQYNDDIALYRLAAPLSDLTNEPDCWQMP